MTLRNILIDISLAMLMASPAGARPGANPPGRLVLGPDGPRAAGPAGGRGALPASAQTVVPVPLPAGAVQLASTWYDLQDMGSLRHRIEVGTDGRVHRTVPGQVFETWRRR